MSLYFFFEMRRIISSYFPLFSCFFFFFFIFFPVFFITVDTGRYCYWIFPLDPL